MYSYNRRAYINRQPEKKIENDIPQSNENADINNLKSVDTENAELLLESVNEIKKSIKKLEETIVDIASRLVSWENHFDIEAKSRNVQRQYEYKSINNELYSQKNTSEDIKPSYQTEEKSNTPIMPGSGFANITAEYLKSLNKSR